MNLRQGDRVTDAKDASRKGVVTHAGEEQSEVRWEDGSVRIVVNQWLRLNTGA
jgi:hypothetical protein